MFEKVVTSKTIIYTNGVTFNQPNNLNDNEIIKEIIQKHKNLLSLSDSKASLANIKSILQHHNISIQSNRKMADLKEVLLKHCNSLSSVFITFVPDYSIENYTEAPKKNFNLHNPQLTDFVPVTFVNDSMINLIKTKGTEAESETAGTKRLDLTAVKHGYTSERHPNKKQKACKAMQNPPREPKITTRRDETEDLTTEQSTEIKSFKEMVAALQKTMLPSSDSEDDFDNDFKLLDKSDDLFFQKLDEPTENKIK